MTKNTKPKILYLITKSNFGGAQRYVFDLAKNSKAENFSVAVAVGGEGELVERLKTEDIPTFKVDGFQRDLETKKEFKSLSSLKKILISFKPDIVHLNSSKAGFLGAIATKLFNRKTKIIFTVHGWPFLEPRKFYWRFFIWLASFFTILLVDKVIFVSQFDLKNSKMPFLKNKSVVIPTAVPNFTLIERNEARQKLFPKKTIKNHLSHTWLVTVAELHKNKNHEAVVDALADFNQQHHTKIFYTIIGDGEELEKLKDQVVRRELADFVFFLGYLKDVRTYLSAFDIFILTSKKEGLPYSILEAGFASLPTIASFVGGIPEIITNHQSGILINPKNHYEIIQALDTLISHPDQRVLFSETLAKKIKTNFSLEKMLKDTSTLYQNTLHHLEK